jgi:hypothetical protein
MDSPHERHSERDACLGRQTMLIPYRSSHVRLLTGELTIPSPSPGLRAPSGLPGMARPSAIGGRG